MYKPFIALILSCIALTGCCDLRDGTVRMVVRDLDSPATVKFYVDGKLKEEHRLEAGKSIEYIAKDGYSACAEINNGKISAAFSEEIPFVNTAFYVSQEGNKYVAFPSYIARVENCSL